MFCLRRTKGETEGDCWPIGAASLFIGRSGQCDITVSDPTVSRRHCEIYAQNGAIHLRDLGSSNLTLVNGQPVKTTRLQPGNRITIGTAHFVLEENGATEAAPEPAEDAGRRSQAVDRNMFVDEERLEEITTLGVKGVEALSRLFRLSRVLSETQTIQEIAMVLHETTADAFKPESCWLARCIEERSSLTFFSASGEVIDAPEDAPRKIIEAAFFRRSGLLWPSKGGNGSMQAVIAAPLVVPEKRVGIIVLRSQPDQVFNSFDLEFLCAIAHTAAPFVKSMEQAEQTQMSLTKLRRQWGL